jgi:hypothetical protein
MRDTLSGFIHAKYLAPLAEQAPNNLAVDEKRRLLYLSLWLRRSLQAGPSAWPDVENGYNGREESHA